MHVRDARTHIERLLAMPRTQRIAAFLEKRGPDATLALSTFFALEALAIERARGSGSTVRELRAIANECEEAALAAGATVPQLEGLATGDA